MFVQSLEHLLSSETPGTHEDPLKSFSDTILDRGSTGWWKNVNLLCCSFPSTVDKYSFTGVFTRVVCAKALE